jgi:YegS/Rv2252/BmrU family lipid kinase
MQDAITASENTGAGSTEPDARRRALLILNRKARSGSGPIDKALTVLAEGGIDADEIDCAGAGAMVRAVRDRAEEASLVIVGGGDGTLNCIASALVETGMPMGILPLGTANDLARTLGIPTDLEGAARIIVDGQIRVIDIGDVNGRHFFNVASIGFSVDLARELTAELKRRWGTLGYAMASARLLARMRPFTAYIEHDGQTLKVKTVQISVGNGRHYGGGLTVDADAEPDDGMLHVYSLEIEHWWQLLALAPALKRGTLSSWRDVRVFTTSEVTIRTRRGRSVNTDGELTSATPAVFKLIPAAVRVFAPPSPSGT